MKKKVMIFTGGYLPGVKGGGPIQSVKNLVDNLSNIFDFYVVTLDRDLGDTEPYRNVKINQWNQMNGTKVYYIGKENLGFKTIKDIINSISPETLYLNSFFSFNFSIIPVILNKLGLVNPQKIVIAPRGEFSEGALNLKTNKKKLFINLAKALKIYKTKNLHWHVTSEFEKNDLNNNSTAKKNMAVCQNFSADYSSKVYNKNVRKDRNKLSLVYVARIHPMKNLKYAIELLQNGYDGDIVFDVYGPIEDKEYWESCKKLINTLPSNVKVNYKGLLEHDLVLKTFSKYHFFLFPTHGENFGHVISESLISGTPVITSDQTPWKDLANKNVGWDIALNETDKFIEVIHNVLSMNQKNYDNMSKSAFSYGKEKAQQKEKIKKMKLILN